MAIISTDIYDLAETVDEVQRQHMESESDRTRAIGINGYFNDINSLQLQNAVIVASELANEMWPSRAKFEKNVIAHAIIYNIEDINAIPATMRVFIGIPELTVENMLTNDRIVFDKESTFYIGGYEFHLQYDLLLIRNTIENNEKVYTAQYDISRPNELSDITNPYITAPFIQTYNTERYLLLEVDLMQVEHVTVSRKLLTSNPIENKTFEFEFENQLAAFEVKITEMGETTYLTPVFEGVGVDQTIENYCYYTYIESNRIRVRFDSVSYMPGMNAQIDVLIKTTHGAEGNFEYNSNFFTSINSDNYGYKNLSLYIIIGSNSENGVDRKSVDELRRILPKEALSRGSITNTQDLLNYFNMLNNDTNRMEIQKKVDNQFERTYYAYLVLKDGYNNVIPTNTIDLIVAKDGEFDAHDNRKYTLKPGCAILYDGKVGRIITGTDILEDYIETQDPNTFVYTVPFTTVLTADPLYMSFYKTIMRYTTPLEFTYINSNAPVQFISTYVVWRRGYVEEPTKYKLFMPLSQNIVADKHIIDTDENGIVVKNTLKVIAVFYNNSIYDDGTVPYRYFEGNLVNYDTDTDYSYDYYFEMETSDKINDDAKIQILNTKIPGSDAEDYGYFSGNVNVKIYTLVQFTEGEFGRYDLDQIVPGLEGYTVTNMYTVENGLMFFENFSDIITSTCTDYSIEGDYEITPAFYIKSVPVMGYSYGNNEENIQTFVEQLEYKKAYIDNGIRLLENNFKIDFKLFNTYGPSRTYSLDDDGNQIIDRVNLTLYFEIKLVKASDTYTKDYIVRDIKEMIEDLNDMTNLHIPNLITEITNKYRPNSIEYIEFLGFNEYGPGVQHLYRNEYDDITIVPEFLTVNTTLDMTADIQIRVV